MFGSYDNNFDSSSDSDTFLPYFFQDKCNRLIANSSLKLLRVEDFETLYITKKKVVDFCKSINVSGSSEKRRRHIEILL